MSVGRLFLEALRFDHETVEGLLARIDAALQLDVGGFIYFGADADTAARVSEAIRSRAAGPLWLAADLERGAGQHLRGLTTFPPPGALAHHPRPEWAVREAARTTAREALGLGLNLAFAPVLDLDVEPRNPIVGTRSFGTDPERVAGLGKEWIDACQAEGIAACAKHFPGHGRTTGDSHAELPAVDATREALEADLRPFRRVAADVACVMSAHVAYPALGAAGPATLERAILVDLLRGELGFEGLVLTDALNMSGVRGGAAGFTSGSPEVRAVEAGCDLLLYPPDLARAIAEIETAAAASERIADRVQESLDRGAKGLERFPGRAPLARGPLSEGTARGAADLAAACVAPVGGEAPPWLSPGVPLRVATVWDDREEPGRPPFGEVFRRELISAGWELLPPGPGHTGAPVLVLIASTPQAWKGTASFTSTARAALDGILAADRVYPILFGHPRLLAELGSRGLCAWANEPAMEEAAARRLVGLTGEGSG